MRLRKRSIDGSSSNSNFNRSSNPCSSSHAIPTINDRTLPQAVCIRFLQVFDCLWTIILFISAIILAISFSPQMIKQILRQSLHHYMYSLIRRCRLVFLVLHSYLILIGMDLTNTCLLQNPTVSNISKCPCIDQPYPLVMHIDYSPLPLYQHHTLYPYILRNAIHTRNQLYGRQTLVEYRNKYGRIPNTCSISHVGSEGPLRIQQIIEESDWKRWSNTSWSLSWAECMDPLSVDTSSPAPYLSSLLPSLESSLFNNHGVPVEPVSFLYHISTQWSKVYGEGIVPDDDSSDSHLMVLVVLQGTVRIVTSISHDCWDYCIDVDKGNILSTGDALLYDKRYLTFTGQTWSNTSFLMLSEIKIG